MVDKETEILYEDLDVHPKYYSYLNNLTDSVRSEVLENIEQIELLRIMVSKKRPKAKDLERDKLGRIKNIEVVYDKKNNIDHMYFKMHELEDMDYFRERALYFQEHGVYTHLYPNRHPNSEFIKFWTEEARRCKEGYVRETDGEWISGYYYWYLNYSPILKTKDILDENGNLTGRAERIYDFPDVWDSDYMFYHYVEKAESLGLFGSVLKTRGRGYSYKCSSMPNRNFYHFPKSKSFALASESEYLTSDGILNKAWDNMDWIDEHTPWRKSREKKNTMDHRVASYTDPESGVVKGTKSEIMGVTLKNNPEKARGKRGKLLLFEESGIFPGLLKAWAIARPSLEDGPSTFGFMVSFGTGGCLTAGNKVWNKYGELKNIENITKEEGIIGFKKGFNIESISWLQPPTLKECLRITTNTGRTLECSLDHPVYKGLQPWKSNITHNEFTEAFKLKLGDHIGVIEEVNIWSEKTLEHAREIGMIIGDGTYGNNQSTRFANADKELFDYLEKNFSLKTLKTHRTKDDREYKEVRILGFNKILRNVGIYGQTKTDKRLPDNIHSYSKKSVCEFIGGLFDTDGHVSIRDNKTRVNKKICEISIAQSSIELIKELQLLLQKLGIHSNIRTRQPRKSNPKDKNPWYELAVRDKKSLINFGENITLLIKNKQEKINQILKYVKTINNSGSSHKGMRYEKIVDITYTGLKTVYNLTADDSNTYIGNGIITHNTEGAAFQGAEELFYNPKGYRILALKNIFDKVRGKGECAFFVPEYMNRKHCYDSNGNSDVIKALSQIIEGREIIRLNSSDPNTLTQEKADRPITPQESVMRKEGTLFPIGDLKDYLAEISPNLQKFTSVHYIGRLSLNPETGKVDYKPDADIKIVREFPIKDNLNKEGGIEIFELPKTGLDGVPPRFRYIAGIDPFDDDHSSTNSLGSMFVMDVLTDRLVCEYTARPKFANTFYENCLRILMFYNAIANYENDKKGLFGYFSNKNQLSYLADNPQILKDMEYTKNTPNYGNKSKGTNSNTKVNAWGRRLQADWMLSKNSDDENLLNLHKIRSIGYLKEAINWNPDGNFDRVSAMGMLMILREDYHKYILHLKDESSGRTNGSSLADDPFFTKNWDHKNKSLDSLLITNNNSYEKSSISKLDERVTDGKIIYKQ